MGTATESTALSGLLAKLRREARLWIWVESLAEVVVATAIVGSGIVLIDWLLEPPAWARGIASASAAGLLAWLVVARLVGRLSTPLSDTSLALAVERRNPALGDTLSTAVDLAARPRGELDPELVDRTKAAAAALAGTVQPATVFRRRRLLAVAATGLAAIAAVAAGATARPDLAATCGRRLVLLEDTPWPRRVTFEAEGFPGGIRKVARGSNVDVVVRARAKGPPPASVSLRIGGAGGWQTVRMGTRGGVSGESQSFGHVLERVTEDTPLEVRGGDGRLRGLRLEVVEPPALAEAVVRIRLPDYLGGGERMPPPLRVVPAPMGSRIDVEFRATKPLQAATITARFADDSPADDAGRELAALEPDAAGEPPTAIAASLGPLAADVALAVAVTDLDGITNQEPLSLLITAVPDEPPEVALRLAGISTAITPQARLPLLGSIADDHGLAEATVRLLCGDNSVSQPLTRVTAGTTLVEWPIAQPATLSLGSLALAPGDRLDVTVTATDACGLPTGPNTGRGETWTLEVVTPEALRASLEAREILLRRRFEAAIDDLTQARRSLAEHSAGDAASRIGEAATRAAGESGEIAAAFLGIRDELDHNAILTPEVETRLVAQVAEPVAAIAQNDLARLAIDAKAAFGSEPDHLVFSALASRTDAGLDRMKAILSRMLELESYNQVIEKLRGMLESQERIRAATLERQRQRAREALEGP